jgi:hypothetical protein
MVQRVGDSAWAKERYGCELGWCIELGVRIDEKPRVLERIRI